LALDPEYRATVGMASVDLTLAAASLTDDRKALLSAAGSKCEQGAFNQTRPCSDSLTLAYTTFLQIARPKELPNATGISQSQFANTHNGIGFAKYCMGRAAETEGRVRELTPLPRDINAYWWMFAWAGKSTTRRGCEAVD
jgi:hypothetical protein